MMSVWEEIDKHTPKRIKSIPRELRGDIKSSMYDINIPRPKWILVFYTLFVFLVYVVFVGRSLTIQVSNKEQFLSLADRNRIREFTILPERGLIYDRNNDLLARNKPSFSIELNTLVCGSYQNCLSSLNEADKYLNFDNYDLILAQLSAKKPNILLSVSHTREQILPLEANIEKMPGISVETAPTRDYQDGISYSHMLGYVGLDDTLTPKVIGKTGIEQLYNSYLSGILGKKIVQVDSNGTQYKLISQINPLPGKDITLFIDRDLQLKAYEYLAEAVESSYPTATAGAVVAQDPTDGSLLALVSYPSFDINKMSDGISKSELNTIVSRTDFPFYDRAVSAAYPPGSTFKLVTASASLEEKITYRGLTIFDPGFIQIGSFIFRNWKTEGHGEVNIIKALQVSNDTYFYTMGGGYGGVVGLGIERLHYWADRFGIGRKTGIDLPGENPGYMPNGTEREWYLGDDYISAIGQGDILATPLQINNMMTYFANGGYLYKPRLVKYVDGLGETRAEVIGEHLITQENYDLVREGIHAAVVAGGTGYPVFDFPTTYPGIELAGKTGTSEYIGSDGSDKTHAWFTVFGPYKSKVSEQTALISTVNRPIVLTVFIEGGGSGSDDAAPVARKVLDFWFGKN